jgi:hypothetical protein
MAFVLRAGVDMTMEGKKAKRAAYIQRQAAK